MRETPFRHRVLFVAMLVALGGTLTAGRLLGDDAQVVRADLPADPADAVEQVLRLSVTIEGSGVYGAGILIDPPRGLVMTSHHVVSEMKAPKITGYDGRTSEARVLTFDKKADIALLEAPGLATPELAPPRLADVTSLRPGEEVFAIGSPRKLPFSVARGIVSYVSRDMDAEKFLQLDMSINEGNSGGPVFNRRGEVVAVMSFVLRKAQGLSFALPMTTAMASLSKDLPKSASAGDTGRWTTWLRRAATRLPTPQAEPPLATRPEAASEPRAEMTP